MAVDLKYYDTLGIKPDADEAEIRRAYKTKAMRHHPDKNPDNPEAHETFQQIAQAYETLSDPDQRAAYDRYGLDSGRQYGPSSSAFDPEDLFAEMFGGMGGGGFSFNMDDAYSSQSRNKKRRPEKSPDTQVELDLTLEEAYTGKTVTMGLERDRTCAACEGIGSKKGAKARTCGRCEGRGVVQGQQQFAPGFIGNVRMQCPSCEGTGSKFREKDQCKRCDGKRVVKQKKKLSVIVEPGSLDAERIVLPQKGDQVPGCPPGDIVFNLSVKSHPAFATGPPSSPNLYLTVSITLSEALLGFNRLLCYHLDGRAIRARSEKGERVIQRHDVYKIAGEGMRRSRRSGRGGGDGDLFVRFEVEMPDLRWARGVDKDTLDVSLPPKKPDINDGLEGTISTPVKLESVPISTPFYFTDTEKRKNANPSSKFERTTAYDEKLRSDPDEHEQEQSWREHGGMCLVQ